MTRPVSPNPRAAKPKIRHIKIRFLCSLALHSPHIPRYRELSPGQARLANKKLRLKLPDGTVRNYLLIAGIFAVMLSVNFVGQISRQMTGL